MERFAQRRLAVCALIVVSVVFLYASSADAPELWLIAPGGLAGAINASTSKKSLVARYGAENVRDEDVDVGEGETEPGTTLFANDHKRSIRILWKDAEVERSPKSVTIHGRSSLWHTVHRITLGTSLDQLEKMNGRPFELTGFEWDYSGTVTSWRDGALAKELETEGRVIVRLEPMEGRNNEQDIDKVAGDKPFLSDDPKMKRINPRVYELIWEFK